MFQKNVALIDIDFKLLKTDNEKGTFELFDLKKDKTESNDISKKKPRKFRQLKNNKVTPSKI